MGLKDVRLLGVQNRWLDQAFPKDKVFRIGCVTGSGVFLEFGVKGVIWNSSLEGGAGSWKEAPNSTRP